MSSSGTVLPAVERAASLPSATRRRPLMGGSVEVWIGHADGDARARDRGSDAAVLADGVLDRLAAWAACLTRFDASSALSRLNVDARSDVPVGPTIAAILDWGRAAEAMTDGIVDITMLDARLRAEGLGWPSDDRTVGASTAAGDRSLGSRSWRLTRHRRGATVHRPRDLRFDLDGVAKGWLADRALRLLPPDRSAVVDADGDVAIRCGSGDGPEIGVADPRQPGSLLATLRLAADDAPASFGVATSGTSVHRFAAGPASPDPAAMSVSGAPPDPAAMSVTGAPPDLAPRGMLPPPVPPVTTRAEPTATFAHHLIDPATRRPARTDIVQATVLAGSAREAEAYAKAAVIVGSADALPLLDRPGVRGALLLTVSGELLALPSTLRWLA